MSHDFAETLTKSLEFYTKLLAWLFNYGVGIHLVQVKDEDKLPSNTDHLDHVDNHISFQCEDMEALEKRLKEVNVKYMKKMVGDPEDAVIEQLFFNDPEICKCENLELKPRNSNSADAIHLPGDRHMPPVTPWKIRSCG